jgi:hypothetical protein
MSLIFDKFPNLIKSGRIRPSNRAGVPPRRSDLYYPDRSKRARPLPLGARSSYRPHLEGCDITSQSIACVGIHGGADPGLLRNRIHDGKMLASMWTTTARGRWRTTTIFGNAFFGRGNQDGVRSAAIKTVGAPIPPLAVGVISEVDATMPPELPEESNFQDDDGTEGWIT